MDLNLRTANLWLRGQTLRIRRPQFQYFWVVFRGHTEGSLWKYLVAVAAHLRAAAITQGLTPFTIKSLSKLRLNWVADCSSKVSRYRMLMCHLVIVFQNMLQALRKCLTKWMNFKKVSNYFSLCLFLFVCAVWPNPSVITFFLFQNFPICLSDFYFIAL